MGGDRFQLRVDDGNRADFEAAGMERVGRMPYYHTPPEVLADEDRFVEWAHGAVGASRRAKAAKPERKK
jgi:TfoX/Sxy family transcriptional regulator of competence genes